MMPNLRPYDLISGIRITISSFYTLKRHLFIIAFASIAPLISFFLSPLLFHLTASVFHSIPEWIFTFLFSFLGLTIFNYVYFGLVIYNFCIAGYVPFYEKKIWQIQIAKSKDIIGWSCISAAISTLLTVAFHQLYGIMFVTFLFKLIDAYWWLINFLIIPAIANESGLLQAIRWTIKTIYQQLITLIGAGATFYIIKHIANQSIYLILLSTPKVLIQTHIISIVPKEDAYTLLVLVSIIGIILTSLCSIATFAIQSIVASALYLKFIGRQTEQIEIVQPLRIIILAAITFIVFCLITFLLSSALMISSWRIPALGKFLIS